MESLRLSSSPKRMPGAHKGTPDFLGSRAAPIPPHAPGMHAAEAPRPRSPIGRRCWGCLPRRQSGAGSPQTQRSSHTGCAAQHAAPPM